MVRNGRNARNARNARSAFVCVCVCDDSRFAAIPDAVVGENAFATNPPYPTTTKKKSKRFHGSRAYFLAPATPHRKASSTVKKTFSESSSVSRVSFHCDEGSSSGRYSASETQLQKMAQTTSASKSSCSTTRIANRRRRVLVRDARRRQAFLRPVLPCVRLFRGRRETRPRGDRARRTRGLLASVSPPPGDVGDRGDASAGSGDVAFDV